MADGGLGNLVGYLSLDSSGFETGLNDATASLGEFGAEGGAAMLAIGASMAVALGGALALGVNTEEANKKLQAQLGLNNQASAKLGKTAGSLYAGNYGESLDQVNEALSFVMRNIEGMANASESDIQRVTKGVINLSNAFGLDLAESTRAVSTMIKTGMAVDATDALDILTAGLQSSVNSADDLKDTFNEYSTVFRTMGIDGGDALGIMQQGLQGGARDADQIADSFKELLLRVQAGDADKGLRAIGLDAKQMSDDISQGGEVAKTATDKIIDGFTGIVDPTEKAKIGVELFGTKAEDAQMALNGLDLSTAKSDFESLNGPIEGTAAAMDAAFNDSRAASISSFKRGLETAGATIGTALLPVVDVALTTLNGLVELISDLAGFFTDLPGPIQLAAAAGALVAISFTAVGTAIKAAFLSNPVGIAIVGITTALGWLIGSTKSAKEIQEEHKAVVDELTDTLEANTGAISENTKQSIIKGLGTDKLLELEGLGIKTADYTEAILGNVEAQKRVKASIDAGLTSSITAQESYTTFGKKLNDLGVSADDLATAFSSGDYSGITKQLEGTGLAVFDLGTGMIQVTDNATGATDIVADMGGKAAGLTNALGELNTKTGQVSEAQANFETNARAAGEATNASADAAKLAAAANLVASGSAATMAEAYEQLGTSTETAAAQKLVDEGKARTLVEAYALLNAGVAGTTVNMDELNGVVTETAPIMYDVETALTAASDATSTLSEEFNFARDALDKLAGRFPSVEEATQSWNDELRGLIESATDSDGAITQLDSSIVDANGNISTVTKAGSDFQNQIQSLADAALNTALAQGQMAGATGGLTAATDAARASTASSREAFIAQIGTLGIVGSQAEELANKYGLVPDQVATQVEQHGAYEAKKAIDEAAAAASALDGKNVTVTTTFTEVTRKILETQQNNYVNNLGSRPTYGFARGGLIGFASGGLVPGMSPADPTVDNLLASGPNGMFGIRSGEFVQPEPAVDYYGVGIMSAMQKMAIPREMFTAMGMNRGGPIGGGDSGGGSAGMTTIKNYNVTVNANAESDIPRLVIQTIKEHEAVYG